MRTYYQHEQGSEVIVVETCAPGHGPMMIGVGDTWYDAVQSIESTPIEGHRDDELGLAWAQSEGWVDDADKLRKIEAPTCCCECDCDEEATTRDDGGNDVCDKCKDGLYDADGDFLGCPREGLGTMCRHCAEEISWSGIQTAESMSGKPNYRLGACQCGEWRDEDRGGWGHYSYEPNPHCECGEATGDRCEWTGPKSETVIVEFMPECLRASHEAARNSGSYPHNGALRLRCESSCADQIVEDNEDWARIVGGAK